MFTCGYCSKLSMKLLQCVCGKAWYCDKNCQKLDWKAHKKDQRLKQDFLAIFLLLLNQHKMIIFVHIVHVHKSDKSFKSMKRP